MERRSQARYDVYLNGELIWGDGAERRRCTIRDISLDGAQVDTNYFVDVPKRLFLLETRSGDLFECQVRWQQGARLGLFFLDVGARSARRALIERHAPRT
jgi:hypothetical protein